jgi:pyruvate dehydrogenase E2 component (dihydrolipoamide acetyltransferase)
LGQLLEICVPDIGDFDEVEVVEILVAKGDHVSFEDPLVSIESDKATMEIPSTAMGVVVELQVAVGDRVSEGSVLVVLETVADTKDQPEEAGAARSEHSESAVVPPPVAAEAISTTETTEINMTVPAIAGRELSRAAANPVPDRSGLPHASPLVRRQARELGVSLALTDGSGNHGRVLVDDLKRHVRERFARDATDGGGPASGIPAMPTVDHASFGPIREEKLTRIQKVSGPVLHRSWLNVPHVTQHDEADVTLLERFRRDRREAAAERGLKLSPLLFVMKAVVIALKEYPTLRASLSPNHDHLVIKEYFHLGIAVDTDQGLVVPVIRDVDRKGIFELAAELNATAERARERNLGPDDLRGACFTISSLGGIGGTAFTPIVNAPEVAILGLSKTRVQPLWQGPSPLDLMESTAGVRRTEITRPSIAVEPAGGADPPPSGHFVPRLVLPFSLSYDHRVIDGALAARFTSRLSRLLSNPMQQLL